MSLEVLGDVLQERRDLGPSGDFIAHLWFLYYLLLMYAGLVAFRLLRRLNWVRTILRAEGRLSVGKYLGNATYTRIPLLLILGAIFLLFLRAGNDSKPIWPPNVTDVLFGAMFFFYRYGLFARRELIDRLKGSRTLAALLAIGTTAFIIHAALIGQIFDMTNQGMAEETKEFLWLVGTFFFGVAAVYSI